jgi:hypothetical protein
MPGVVSRSGAALWLRLEAQPLLLIRPIPGFLNEHYLYTSKREFILGTEKTTIKHFAALECLKSFSK